MRADTKITPLRLSAALIALAAWVGLGAQVIASIGLTGSVGLAAWAMLRYFTVITNLLVAIAFSGLALGGKRFARPGTLGGLTLCIMLVGVVFALLLNGLVELSGGAMLADWLLHKVTPVLVPIYWLLFVPKGQLRPSHPPRWAIYPLAYFAYALGRGAIDGRYAYPFLDADRLGWPAVVGNGGLIALCFVLAGFALVWLDRGLGAAANG